MNRLFVWLVLVIVLIVIIVAFFSIATNWMNKKGLFKEFGEKNEMNHPPSNLTQEQWELEKGEEQRKKLLADVTHELNHPIHIFQGNLQAILDGVYDLDFGEIARLFSQTKHLQKLVDDLHELALAEAQELDLIKTEADLTKLVSDTIEMYQSLALEDGISIESKITEDGILYTCDPDRVRQALQNLLLNAIRYTPKDGKIMVGITRASLDIEISVKDSGIGIPSDQIDYVFDRFYRADTSRNRNQTGTGLGLAIAQAFIKAHGGIIKIHSEGKGKGSEFIICLPTSENEVTNKILREI
jgi:signal transduction histidine kinase